MHQTVFAVSWTYGTRNRMFVMNGAIPAYFIGNLIVPFTLRGWFITIAFCRTFTQRLENEFAVIFFHT